MMLVVDKNENLISKAVVKYHLDARQRLDHDALCSSSSSVITQDGSRVRVKDGGPCWGLILTETEKMVVEQKDR